MLDVKKNALSDLGLRVIGRIRSPFTEANGTPIQPAFADDAEGRVVVDDLFSDALDDIMGFERIWLIYWMDRAAAFNPHVVPYRDTRKRGLFATRSPCRPNPLGLSVVRLLDREACILRISDVDILDNTPLLDIKPYVPHFDAHQSSKAGWLETSDTDRKKADERFYKPTGSKSGERK